MDLAGWMIVATSVTFAVGATFALAWSIASGQWKDLGRAARVVLEEDPSPELSTSARARGGSWPKEDQCL